MHRRETYYILQFEHIPNAVLCGDTLCVVWCPQPNHLANKRQLLWRLSGMRRTRTITTITTNTIHNPSERQLEGKLIDFDEVVDHQAGPGDPAHVAVANKVH